MFLDFWGCNLVGMIIAYFMIRYFDIRMMVWIYDARERKNPTKSESDVAWCLPILRQPQFVGLSNLRKFIGATLFLIGSNMFDFNNFHLALTQRMASNHTMLTSRVFLYGFNSIPIVREFYD